MMGHSGSIDGVDECGLVLRGRGASGGGGGVSGEGV